MVLHAYEVETCSGLNTALLHLGWCCWGCCWAVSAFLTHLSLVIYSYYQVSTDWWSSLIRKQSLVTNLWWGEARCVGKQAVEKVNLWKILWHRALQGGGEDQLTKVVKSLRIKFCTATHCQRLWPFSLSVQCNTQKRSLMTSLLLLTVVPWLHLKDFLPCVCFASEAY